MSKVKRRLDPQSEAFVQTLADDTGGACELVSPHEDMAEKIVRHFKRIYLPRAEDVKISWPCEPDKGFPAQVGNIYDGDTLHVFSRSSGNDCTHGCSLCTQRPV